MAEIKKGILGGFSGTVGTVVGSNWRGKDIIKSRPKASRKQPTAKQLEQRLKFTAAVNFLTPLKQVQNAYFGSKAGSRSRANLAVSYMMREAMEMSAGAPVIHFSKVQVTKGELTGFQNLSAAAGTDGHVAFTWQDNSAQAKAAADDVFCAAFYCEELREFHTYDGPETRSAEAATVALPAAFAGKQVHVYAYLHDAACSSACNSVYLNTLRIS